MIRLVASLWAGAVLIGSQDPTVAGELPTVRAIQGDLHVWNAAKDKLAPLTDPLRVTPSDRIGTKKDRLAVLATQDGSLISLSEVEVGREKGISLERTKDKLLIKLYKGKIALDTFQTGLRVETPNGVIEGDRGYCVVEVDGKKTRIVAVSDPLTFVNSLGTVKLEPGQESTAERTTKPSDPKAADVEKATGDATAATASVNLIKNPGFEEGSKEWSVEQIHGKDATTVENSGSHGGRQCARVEISNRIFGVGSFGGWLGVKQYVRLTPGKRYLFRAYARQETREGTVKPFFSIAAENGPRWYADPSRKGWQRIGGIYTAESEKSSRVSIEAEVQSERYDALVWLDDLLLLELK